jgi:hypothetical protein
MRKSTITISKRSVVIQEFLPLAGVARTVGRTLGKPIGKATSYLSGKGSRLGAKAKRFIRTTGTKARRGTHNLYVTGMAEMPSTTLGVGPNAAMGVMQTTSKSGTSPLTLSGFDKYRIKGGSQLTRNKANIGIASMTGAGYGIKKIHQSDERVLGRRGRAFGQ